MAALVGTWPNNDEYDVRLRIVVKAAIANLPFLNERIEWRGKRI